jgi:APA family basic amino acid/polyamine antiporter
MVYWWCFSAFGAFCYAELGTFFKGNGGDYIYLSKTYHPILGYLSSWISLVIGFSSPVSLAALAMAKYMSVFQGDFGTFLQLRLFYWLLWHCLLV